MFPDDGHGPLSLFALVSMLRKFMQEGMVDMLYALARHFVCMLTSFTDWMLKHGQLKSMCISQTSQMHMLNAKLFTAFTISKLLVSSQDVHNLHRPSHTSLGRRLSIVACRFTHQGVLGILI